MAQRKSYSLFRYLYAKNIYSAVYAPLHDGILFNTLQARSQGLSNFEKTTFITDLDALPLGVLERIRNEDLDGQFFGKKYAVKEKEAIEQLKAEFMAEKTAEMTDMLLIAENHRMEFLKADLKWKFDREKVTRISEFPKKSVSLSGNHRDIEFVFLGTPHLSIASGIKLFADALDISNTEKEIKITVLGFNVELSNPKLFAKEFLDLRSYSWVNAKINFVEVEGKIFLSSS